MRENSFLGCIFLFYGATLFAVSPAMDPSSSKRTQTPFYVEAKAGYFFFSSSNMRDVYDQGGIDLQFSAAYPILPYIRIYGSIEYLTKSGYSLGGNQKTQFWALPLSMGLQAAIDVCSTPTIAYYFTVGPRYFFTRVHNDSSYVSRHMHSDGFGGFANTGFLFTLYRNLNLDVFGEYSYGRLSYSSSVPNSEGRTAQVGGFTIGGGLAYLF